MPRTQPPADEPDLIRAARRGDREAFGELVRRKRERVVRIAWRITGDAQDALDVAQAVFLRLWQGLASYDPEQRLDTWIYRITVNAAIDSLRSRGARGPHEPLEVEPAAPETRGAVDPLDRARLRAAFERLAARLAPRQRAAFVLREIEGLETDQVAQTLGVSASTVRNHVLQARRVLREGLRRDYPELLAAAGATGLDDEGEA